MAVQLSRVFSSLFFLSLISIICFLSWEHHYSWTTLVNKHRVETSSLRDFSPVLDNGAKMQIKAVTPMPVLIRKHFKRAPVWDFAEVYNQDAPPLPSTCAQSLRNSKNEFFKQHFLPNIRLYLHKDNINMSEWNRLSHFNDPFGFMEYKYEEMMPIIKLIPTPKEPLLSPKPGGDGCIRCAVVGNGGILNGSKMGAEIDAHDYVFRMNGAITKGYEEDVGNRTSVYVHTAHAITTTRLLLRRYGYRNAPHDEGIKYVLIPERQRDYNWLNSLLRGQRIPDGHYRNKEPRKYYSGQFDENRFYVLHQDFLRYILNRFFQSKKLNRAHWEIYRPSNGAFTIFLALHTCDTVDAYGFMTEDYYKYSKYYVHDVKKKVTAVNINHNFILEKDLWYKLHTSKILKLYQRMTPKTKNQTSTDPPTTRSTVSTI